MYVHMQKKNRVNTKELFIACMCYTVLLSLLTGTKSLEEKQGLANATQTLSPATHQHKDTLEFNVTKQLH